VTTSRNPAQVMPDALTEALRLTASKERVAREHRRLRAEEPHLLQMTDRARDAIVDCLEESGAPDEVKASIGALVDLVVVRFATAMRLGSLAGWKASSGIALEETRNG